MICNDCNATLKPRELSCYRCGWKLPPHVPPVIPQAPFVEATERSAADIAQIRQLVGRRAPQDPKAWARRLLDRAARGEKVSPLQFEAASEALKCVAQQRLEREPGADDEMATA